MCGYLGIDWRAVAAGLASAVLLCAFAVVVPTIPSATVLVNRRLEWATGGRDRHREWAASP